MYIGEIHYACTSDCFNKAKYTNHSPDKFDIKICIVEWTKFAISF